MSKLNKIFKVHIEAVKHFYEIDTNSFNFDKDCSNMAKKSLNKKEIKCNKYLTINTLNVYLPVC